MLIDILRHGQPEGGDILRGRVDLALTEAGWSQMYTSVGLEGATAGAVPFTHIVSSPLQRCRKFAEALSTSNNIPLVVEPDWQEIDYGLWDGMEVSEWRKVAAEQFRAFRQDMTALAPPEGELYVDFRDRVLRAWEQLSGLSQGMTADSHVLLITHGGVMRVILPTVLGMPLNRTGVLQIPFACLSRIEVSHAADKSHSSLLFHNGRLG